MIRRWTALRARSAAEPARRLAAAEAHRAPELGGEEVDLLSGPGRARRHRTTRPRRASRADPRAGAGIRRAPRRRAARPASPRSTSPLRASPASARHQVEHVDLPPGSATSRARYCRPRLSFSRNVVPCVGDRPVLPLERHGEKRPSDLHRRNRCSRDGRSRRVNRRARIKTAVASGPVPEPLRPRLSSRPRAKCTSPGIPSASPSDAAATSRDSVRPRSAGRPRVMSPAPARTECARGADARRAASNARWHRRSARRPAPSVQTGRRAGPSSA